MLTYNPGEENSKIKLFQIRMGRDYSKYYIYDTTTYYMLSIQSSLKRFLYFVNEQKILEKYEKES